jgi:hypothetical protein
MCACNREYEAETDWGFIRKSGSGWTTASSGELAFEPETLEMEGPKGKVTIGGPPSKTRIELDMVLDAIDKGTTDPNKLIDLVFHKRHPELGGRRLKTSERTLIKEWNSLRELVSAALTIDSIRKLGKSRP